MGHSRASKAKTHARLVGAAAARFKERGFDGISLADLMKELKLTHGGFYKHFTSREELVEEALELGLADSASAMRERLFDGGKPTLSEFVDFYLGEAHCDGLAGGCAVAALAGDAPRKSAKVQSRFRAQIDANLDLLAEALPEGPAHDARERAVVILSALYGALIMARAVGDSTLSREILRTVRKGAVALAGPMKKRARARATDP